MKFILCAYKINYILFFIKNLIKFITWLFKISPPANAIILYSYYDHSDLVNFLPVDFCILPSCWSWWKNDSINFDSNWSDGFSDSFGKPSSWDVCRNSVVGRIPPFYNVHGFNSCCLLRWNNKPQRCREIKI